MALHSRAANAQVTETFANISTYILRALKIADCLLGFALSFYSLVL